jgi:hypothetical protein
MWRAKGRWVRWVKVVDNRSGTRRRPHWRTIVVAVEGAKTLANTLVLELEELEVVAAVAGDSPIGFSGNSVR